METASGIGLAQAVVGIVSGLVVAGITTLTFWMRFADRITAAEKDANVAKKDARDAADRIAFLTAEFGLYREQIAGNYIHREVMREVEDRLTAAIDRLGDRLDRFTEAAMHYKN